MSEKIQIYRKCPALAKTTASAQLRVRNVELVQFFSHKQLATLDGGGGSAAVDGRRSERRHRPEAEERERDRENGDDGDGDGEEQVEEEEEEEEEVRRDAVLSLDLPVLLCSFTVQLVGGFVVVPASSLSKVGGFFWGGPK